MESQYLQHWGIKGMKWGVRRFQNKDGSLTPDGRKRYNETDGTQEETVEQKRARLLKSTDAKELYENRSLLTTNELNDRINRIDTEARLQSKIKEEPKPTIKSVVDKIVSAGKSINDVYEMTQKPVFKALSKALGFTPPEKPFSWDNVSGKLGSLSSDEVQKLAKRAANEKVVRSYLDDLKKAASKQTSEAETKAAEAANKAKAEQEYQRMRDEQDYNDRMNSGSYSKKGDRVVDSKWTSDKAEKGREVLEGNAIIDKDGSIIVLSKEDADTGREYVNKFLGLPGGR